MRVVFDNNVLISSVLIKNSIPDKALKKALADFTLLCSMEVFNEFVATLCNPKFDKYVSLGTRKSVLKYFESVVFFIEPTDKISVCRDPKDNMVLELALSGTADFIITGDSDLLVLHPFRNISIISPKDFLDNYE
jgi:uncharacterized protein